ncbi:hypothetical protein ACNVED_02420 [Legionella sp. D16C41]|uniref:hypothetical protein n=1 Tax=Legionella sp. D16C41 TaxID=3402688 RepID=UPI003AF912E4
MRTSYLFKNANLILTDFNELQEGYDVLVQDNEICAVSKTPTHSDATIVETKGMTLMPGLIDSLIQRIESAEVNNLAPSIIENLKKTHQMSQQVYKWAKKYQLNIGFGIDLWGPEAQKEKTREFEMRQELDLPINIIRSATEVNANLLMQKDKLGTIASGAYADLLVVRGNPLIDLELLYYLKDNLMLIMKDGVIYKNLLH